MSNCRRANPVARTKQMSRLKGCGLTLTCQEESRERSNKMEEVGLAGKIKSEGNNNSRKKHHHIFELCTSYELTHLILPTISKVGINITAPLSQMRDPVDAIVVAYLNSVSYVFLSISTLIWFRYPPFPNTEEIPPGKLMASPGLGEVPIDLMLTPSLANDLFRSSGLSS